jgi:hypothetical protein
MGKTKRGSEAPAPEQQRFRTRGHTSFRNPTAPRSTSASSHATSAPDHNRKTASLWTIIACTFRTPSMRASSISPFRTTRHLDVRFISLLVAPTSFHPTSDRVLIYHSVKEKHICTHHCKRALCVLRLMTKLLGDAREYHTHPNPSRTSYPRIGRANEHTEHEEVYEHFFPDIPQYSTNYMPCIVPVAPAWLFSFSSHPGEQRVRQAQLGAIISTVYRCILAVNLCRTRLAGMSG